MPTPEEKARQVIDQKLSAAGWIVQDLKQINLAAGLGIAVREFPTASGEADYLLFVDRHAVGVVEAKPEGTTLRGVAEQTARYQIDFPQDIPHVELPLPFGYESTGAETFFVDLRDPDYRSRRVFAFHKPDTLREWAGGAVSGGHTPGGHTPGGHQPGEHVSGGHTGPPLPGPPLPGPPQQGPPQPDPPLPITLRARLRNMPPLHTEGLWGAQIEAITSLERSLAENHPRALIQMATGSGKTFTAVSFIYRLIKFAGAKRVLFLVDRNNLGRQTLREFQGYVTPDDGRKFTELYNVQRLTSNVIDPVSKVTITTIQRLYSMLKGEEFTEELEEPSWFELAAGIDEKPRTVEYNPDIPIETYDFIITDECHRSIYNLWRQVLEYFDAFLIGLTATPSKYTLGFFYQNLVTEYSHERAVADGVNVGYEVYRIRTRITQEGSTVEAGHYIDLRDKKSRSERWAVELDEDLEYHPTQLDRDVVAPDQIRTVIRTFREKLFTEIFPGRTEVPKTLVFAKDDSHAEDIVEIVRQEFGKGDEFCKKITYKTTGEKPEDLIASFRNSYNPRIAVSVDMISTGTDIKPLECLLFLRTIKSQTYFEQMKGRGTRVISPTDITAVTSDAGHKTHFVIVDAVGVCEEDKTDTRPLERARHVPFDKLMLRVALGVRDPDALTSLAGRLARLDRELYPKDRTEVAAASGGISLKELANRLLDAVDPDVHIRYAIDQFGFDPAAAERADTGLGSTHRSTPTEAIEQAKEALVALACAPFDSEKLRQTLEDLQKRSEQYLDVISKDEVLDSSFDEGAKEKAQRMVSTFRQFIQDNKDELAALQILYSQPYGTRHLTYQAVKELAEAIARPPYHLTAESLWRAYEQLDKSRVRGAGPARLLTDIISLVRFALERQEVLEPFPLTVEERYRNWLLAQLEAGRQFSEDQLAWLGMIKDHIAANAAIEMEDFELTPFNQHGGAYRAHRTFEGRLDEILAELNRVLVS